MSEIHLVTGATGFVGGALTLELLSQTGATILCLVRSKHGMVSPQIRLQYSLAAAARAYGRANLIPDIERRCHAIAGDILQPFCGNSAGLHATVSEVWHCAASLQFEDEYESAIFAHNVHGTANVLHFASRLKAKTFNYISTAYVSGSRSGRILEDLPSLDTPTNNLYEKSKIQAEIMVAAASGFHTRILRPSIVVGDSRTLAATSFSGLYGFIRELTKFKRKVARRLGGYLVHRPLRVWADELTPVNLIPVDAVASNAVKISLSRSLAPIFHLTNDCPLPAGASVASVFEEVALRTPRFVSSAIEFTSIDETLDRAIRFYRSYLSGMKVFDRTNADAVLGRAASEWSLEEGKFSRYIRWYLIQLADAQTRDVRPATGLEPAPVPVTFSPQSCEAGAMIGL